MLTRSFLKENVAPHSDEVGEWKGRNVYVSIQIYSRMHSQAWYMSVRSREEGSPYK
jgi:hypothetical protein